MFHRLRSAAAPVLAFCFFSAPVASATDFDLAGREMSRMLQNGHYARPSFDADLGQRIFDGYIDSLDPDRLYFVQSDIDRYTKKYSRRFHELLMTGEALNAATEIFETYRQRVTERVLIARSLLTAPSFSFDGERSVIRDREDEPWPVSDAAANAEWKLRVEEAFLSEKIRREKMNARAKEQQKESPFEGAPPAASKVLAAYERSLKLIADSDEEDIANYFYSAVARSYDPHSEYFSSREFERFRIDISNELVGIGARLSSEDDGTCMIVGVMTGGPADKQGDLEPGDKIIAVDTLGDGEWVDTRFMPLDKVIEKILGKVDTKVGLKLKPSADKPDEERIIVIKRGRITIKDDLVTSEVYEFKKGDEIERYAVIHIPSFYFDFESKGNRVSVDLEKILNRLDDEKVDGIAIDVRRNGGGSLDEVRRMVGFFVGRGPVVQVKSTNGRIQALTALRRRALYNGPLVVLTDKGSASATEILAGALQDYNRAVVVGESSTFGKGTVQKFLEISDYMPVFSDRERAGRLKLTIQKYYRPSGSSVQQEGVVPDIILPSLSDVRERGEKYADHALAHDIIREAEGMRPMNRDALFVPVLREKSVTRRKMNLDFQYLGEDIVRYKKKLDENRNSLNIETRRAEVGENEGIRKARNAERQKRFAEIEAADRKSFTVYRLTLDDLQTKPLPLFDPKAAKDGHYRMVENKIKELDDSPDWPSGLDSVKREGLNVLRDLVAATRAGLVAARAKKQ